MIIEKIKSNPLASAFCAALVISVPMAFHVADAAEDITVLDTLSQAQVQAHANFVTAARVEFEHVSFILPNYIQYTDTDNVENTWASLSVDAIQKANVTVHGGSGEIAQFDCEIQQVQEFDKIQTYDAVSSTTCAKATDKDILTMGKSLSSDVELGAVSEEQPKVQSYVSLKISYI